MKINIHQANLDLVWACLQSGYPEVWLHGSGDVFPVYAYNPLEQEKQDHSKNHAEQFNRGHEENSYRVKFNLGNFNRNIGVKDVEKMLLNEKLKEENQKNQVIQQNGNTRITNVRVDDFAEDIHEPAGEIDYSKFTKK